MFLHAMKRGHDEFALVAHDLNGVTSRQSLPQFGQARFDVVYDVNGVFARLAADVEQQGLFVIEQAAGDGNFGAVFGVAHIRNLDRITGAI